MTDAGPVTVSVLMEGAVGLLDPDGLAILDPDSGAIEVSGWEDVLTDIRSSVPITFTTGNQGFEVDDRVADEGVLTLAFDNSENNSAGLRGYYSPDHPNCRTGFTQEAPILLTIAYGGTTYYQWQGVLNVIKPSAGVLGDRLTMVEAVDYIHYLMETDFVNVNVQANKKDDELLTTLIACAPVAPFATDFDTGDDSYAYAFHDEISGTSKLLTVIQKLMMSGLGKFYIKSGVDNAETLTYISRSNTLIAGSPVYEFNDDAWDVQPVRDDWSRVRQVTVEVNPVQIDASDVVLWQLNNEMTLGGGEAFTFSMALRDPNGRAQRVAALSMVPPVADTDFKFSSTSGSGNDKNADITFTYSDGADAIDVTIANTSASTGYLWFFQPRGKGIYLYEPTRVSQLTGQSTGRNLTINMPYQSNILVGKDILTVVSDWYKVPQSNVAAVKFCANLSDALMTAALTGQIGDYFTVAETQTGISTGFFINGKRMEIRDGGKRIDVTWFPAPAQLLYAFILDLSQLDVDKLGV